jgi:hypothetical protein
MKTTSSKLGRLLIVTLVIAGLGYILKICNAGAAGVMSVSC